MLDRGRVGTSAHPPKGARELTTELAVWGRDEEKEVKPSFEEEGRDGDDVCESADEARKAVDAADGGLVDDAERQGEDDAYEVRLPEKEGVGPPVWNTLRPFSSAGGGEGGSYGRMTGEPV